MSEQRRLEIAQQLLADTNTRSPQQRQQSHSPHRRSARKRPKAEAQSVLYNSKFETTMRVDRLLQETVRQMSEASEDGEVSMQQLARMLAKHLNDSLWGCQCSVGLVNAAHTELLFVDAHTAPSAGVQALQKRVSLVESSGSSLPPASRCFRSKRTLCAYSPQLVVYLPMIDAGSAIGVIEVHGALPEDERRWEHYRQDGEALLAMARADQTVFTHMRLWKAPSNSGGYRQPVAGKVSNVLSRSPYPHPQRNELYEIEWEDGTVQRGVTAKQMAVIMGTTKLSIGFGIVFDGRLQALLETVAEQCGGMFSSRKNNEIVRRLRRSLHVHGVDLSGIISYCLKEILDIFPSFQQVELVQYSLITKTSTSLCAHPVHGKKTRGLDKSRLSDDNFVVEKIGELCRRQRSFCCQMPGNQQLSMVSLHQGSKSDALAVDCRVLLLKCQRHDSNSEAAVLLPNLRFVASALQSCIDEAQDKMGQRTKLKAAQRSANDLCAQWSSLSEVSLAEKLCEVLATILPDEPFYIGLADSMQRELTFVASSNSSSMRGVTLSGGRGLSFAAMATKAPLVLTASDGGVVRDVLEVGTKVHVLYGLKEHPATITCVRGHGCFDIKYNDGTSEAGVPCERVISQASRHTMQTFGRVEYPIFILPLHWDGIATGVLIVEHATNLTDRITPTMQHTSLDIRRVLEAVGFNVAKAVLQQRHQKKIEAIRAMQQLSQFSVDEIAAKCGAAQLDYLGPVDAAGVFFKTQADTTMVWDANRTSIAGGWLRQLRQQALSPIRKPVVEVGDVGTLQAIWPMWRGDVYSAFIFRAQAVNAPSDRMLRWLQEAAVVVSHVLLTSMMGQQNHLGLEAKAIALLDEHQHKLETGQAVNVEQLIPAVLDVCKQVCPASNMYVAVLDANNQHLVVRYGTSSHTNSATFTATHHPRLFAQLSQVVDIHVQQTSEISAELGSEMQLNLPMLLAPLLLGADVVKGFLIIDSALTHQTSAVIGSVTWMDVVHRTAEVVAELLHRSDEQDIDEMIDEAWSQASLKIGHPQRMLQSVIRKALPSVVSAGIYTVSLDPFLCRMPKDGVQAMHFAQNRPMFVHAQIVAFSPPSRFQARTDIDLRVWDQKFKPLYRTTLKKTKSKLPSFNLRVNIDDARNFPTLVCEFSCKNEHTEVELDKWHLSSVFQRRMTYHFLRVQQPQGNVVHDGFVTLDAWMDDRSRAEDAVPTISFSVAIAEIIGLCSSYWFSTKQVECVVRFGNNEIARLAPNSEGITPSWPQQWLTIDTGVASTAKRDTMRTALSSMRLTVELTGVSRSSKARDFALMATFSASQLGVACQGTGMIRSVASRQSTTGFDVESTGSIAPAPVAELRCAWPKELLEADDNMHARLAAAAATKPEHNIMIWIQLVAVMNVQALLDSRTAFESSFYLLVCFNASIVGVVEFELSQPAPFEISLANVMNISTSTREARGESLTVELWQNHPKAASHQLVARTVVISDEVTFACAHAQARDFILPSTSNDAPDSDATMLRLRLARTLHDDWKSNPFPISTDDHIEALIGDANELLLIHQIHASNLARADILTGSNPFLICRWGRQVLAHSDTVMHTQHPTWTSQFIVAFQDDEQQNEADIEIEIWSAGKRGNTLLGGVILSADTAQTMANADEPISLPLQVLKRHKRYSLSTAQGSIHFHISRQRSESLLQRNAPQATNLAVPLQEQESLFKISTDTIRAGPTTPTSSHSAFGGESSSDLGTDTARREDSVFGADIKPHLVILGVSGILPVHPLYGTDMACVVKMYGGRVIGQTSTVLSADQPSWPNESFELPSAPLLNIPSNAWLTIEVWHALQTESEKQLLAIAECTWRTIQEAAQTGATVRTRLACSRPPTESKQITEPTMTFQILMEPSHGDQCPADTLQPSSVEIGDRPALELGILSASDIPSRPEFDETPARLFCLIKWRSAFTMKTHSVRDAKNVMWLAELLYLPDDDGAFSADGRRNDDTDLHHSILRIELRRRDQMIGWAEFGRADLMRMLDQDGMHECLLSSSLSFASEEPAEVTPSMVITLRKLLKPNGSSGARMIPLVFRHLQPNALQWIKFVVRRNGHVIGIADYSRAQRSCTVHLEDKIAEPVHLPLKVEVWANRWNSDVVEVGTILIEMNTTFVAGPFACQLAPVNSTMTSNIGEGGTIALTMEIDLGRRMHGSVVPNQELSIQPAAFNNNANNRSKWVCLTIVGAVDLVGPPGSQALNPSCVARWGAEILGETEVAKGRTDVTWEAGQFFLLLSPGLETRQKQLELTVWNNDRTKRSERLGTVTLSHFEVVELAGTNHSIAKALNPTNLGMPSSGQLLIYCDFHAQLPTRPRTDTSRFGAFSGALLFDILDIEMDDDELQQGDEWRVRWNGAIVHNSNGSAKQARLQLPIYPRPYLSTPLHVANNEGIYDFSLSIELWSSTRGNSKLYGVWTLPEWGLLHTSGAPRWEGFQTPTQFGKVSARCLIRMEVKPIRAVACESVMDEQRPLNIHIVAASGLGFVESTRLPNAYCVVKEGAKVHGSTEMIAASQSPEWQNGVFTIYAPLKQRMLIDVEIHDVDSQNNRTSIGKVTIPGRLFSAPSTAVHLLDIVADGVHASDVKSSLGKLHVMVVEKSRRNVDATSTAMVSLPTHRSVKKSTTRGATADPDAAMAIGKIVDLAHCHILPESPEYLAFPFTSTATWHTVTRMNDFDTCNAQPVLVIRRAGATLRGGDILIMERLAVRTQRLLCNQVTQAFAAQVLQQYQQQLPAINSEEELFQSTLDALDVIAPGVAVAVALWLSGSKALEVVNVNKHSGRMGQYLGLEQTWIGAAIFERRMITIMSPQDLKFHSVVLVGGDGQFERQRFPVAAIPLITEFGLTLGALVLEGMPSVGSAHKAALPGLPFIEALCSTFAESLYQCKLREWKRQMHVAVLQRHPTYTLQILSEAVLDILRSVKSVEMWETSADQLSSILFCSSPAKGGAVSGKSQIRDVKLQLQESWLEQLQVRCDGGRRHSTGEQTYHFVLSLLSGASETNIPISSPDQNHQMHFRGPLSCKIASHSQLNFVVYCVRSDWSIVDKARGTLVLPATLGEGEKIECWLLRKSGEKAAFLDFSARVRDSHDQRELLQYFDRVANCDVHIRIASATNLQPITRFRKRSQAYCVIRCGGEEVLRTATAKGADELRWDESVAVDGKRLSNLAKSRALSLCSFEVWVVDQIGRFRVLGSVQLTAADLFNCAQNTEVSFNIVKQQQQAGGDAIHPAPSLKIEFQIRERDEDVHGDDEAVGHVAGQIRAGKRDGAQANSFLKIQELWLHLQPDKSSETSTLFVKCFRGKTLVGQTHPATALMHIRWIVDFIMAIELGSSAGAHAVEFEVWQLESKSAKLIGRCTLDPYDLESIGGSVSLPVMPTKGNRPIARVQLLYGPQEHCAGNSESDSDIFAFVEIRVVDCSSLAKFDAFHSPSPYCVIQFNDQICGGTLPVKHTTNPSWDASIPVTVAVRHHHTVRATTPHILLEVRDESSSDGDALIGCASIPLTDAIHPSVGVVSFELLRPDRHGQWAKAGEVRVHLMSQMCRASERCHAPPWLRVGQQATAPQLADSVPVDVIPDPEAEAIRATRDRISMESSIAGYQQKSAAYLNFPFDKTGSITEMHLGQIWGATQAGKWTTLRFDGAEVLVCPVVDRKLSDHSQLGPHLLLARAPTGAFSVGATRSIQELLDAYTAAMLLQRDCQIRQQSRTLLQSELEKLRVNDVDYFINICELLESDLPACGFGACSVDVRWLQAGALELDSVLSERRTRATRVSIADFLVLELLGEGFVVASDEHELWLSHALWTVDCMVPLALAIERQVVPLRFAQAVADVHARLKATHAEMLVFVPIWSEQQGAVGVVWIECPETLPMWQLKLTEGQSAFRAPEPGILPLLQLISSRVSTTEPSYRQRLRHVEHATPAAKADAQRESLGAVRERLVACWIWLNACLRAAVPGIVQLEIWVMVNDSPALSSSAPLLGRVGSSVSRRSMSRNASARGDRFKASLNRLLSAASSSRLLRQRSGHSISFEQSPAAKHSQRRFAKAKIHRFELAQANKVRGEIRPTVGDGLSQHAHEFNCQEWLRCEQLAQAQFRVAPGYLAVQLDCPADVQTSMSCALLSMLPDISESDIEHLAATATIAVVATTFITGAKRRWGTINHEQEATIAEVCQQFAHLLQSQLHSDEMDNKES